MGLSVVQAQDLAPSRRPIKIGYIGVGEKALWVKCSLCKLEDPSVVFENPCKGQDWWCHPELQCSEW